MTSQAYIGLMLCVPARAEGVEAAGAWVECQRQLLLLACQPHPVQLHLLSEVWVGVIGCAYQTLHRDFPFPMTQPTQNAPDHIPDPMHNCTNHIARPDQDLCSMYMLNSSQTLNTADQTRAPVAGARRRA